LCYFYLFIYLKLPNGSYTSRDVFFHFCLQLPNGSYNMWSRFFFFFPLSKGSYFSQLPNGSFQLTTSSQLGIEMEMGKFQFPFSTSIPVANVCSLFFFFLFLTIKWQLINCTPIDYCNCCQLEMKMETFQSPFLSSIYTWIDNRIIQLPCKKSFLINYRKDKFITKLLYKILQIQNSQWKYYFNTKFISILHVIIDILHKSNIKNHGSDTNVDQKRKLTCENSLSYFWINYFSATSITRTKVIFHSTNVFVNLVKLIQRVKMGEEKKRTMFF